MTSEERCALLERLLIALGWVRLSTSEDLISDKWIAPRSSYSWFVLSSQHCKRPSDWTLRADQLSSCASFNPHGHYSADLGETLGYLQSAEVLLKRSLDVRNTAMPDVIETVRAELESAADVLLNMAGVTITTWIASCKP